MMGRQHRVISLLQGSLLFLVALFYATGYRPVYWGELLRLLSNPYVALAYLLYAFFLLDGVAGPDSDAQETESGRASRSLSGSLVRFTYELLGVRVRHRGVMHTFYSAAIAGLYGLLVGSLVYVVVPWSVFLYAPALGVFIGWVLHLVQDSMTVSGVDWLSTGHRLRGSIVTGLSDDEYAVVVVSVTLGVLAHLACLGAPVYKAFLESTLASLALYAVPVIDRFAAKI